MLLRRPFVALLAITATMAVLGALAASPATTAMPAQPTGTATLPAGTVPAPRVYCDPPTPGARPTSYGGPNLVVRGMEIGLVPCETCARGGQWLGVVVEVGNAGTWESGPFLVEVNGAVQAVRGLHTNQYVNLWFPGYQIGENVAIVDPVNQVMEVMEPGGEADNTLRGVLATHTRPMPVTCTPDPHTTPTPRPDLAIPSLRIALAPDWECGRPTTLGLHVAVANQGQAAAGPFVVTANNTPRAHGELAPGADDVVWFPGYRYMTEQEAAVDTANQVYERDETNNVRREMVPIPTPPLCPTVTPTAPGPLPDLIVSSARWQMAGFNGWCVRQDGPPELLATVKNIGAGAAGAFTVRTDPARASWRIDGGLAAGASADVREVIPNGADYVVVDADDEVAEAEEMNNRLRAPNPTWTPPPICTAEPSSTPSVTPKGPTPVPTATPWAIHLPWLEVPGR